MNNPLKSITKKEWALWIGSVGVILLSNILTGKVDFLMLVAALVGVTSLVLAAKGNFWSQILMIAFSILYAIISWQFRYWGEMITYLGMTLPMAVWSLITWMKNPSESGNEVAIQMLTRKQFVVLLLTGGLVTALFYYILVSLNTPNILLSTISITTSFLAAALTMLRSSYYALGYATNDMVLIILWVLASMENPVYLPVVLNFVIFLLNDLYGFRCWKKREVCLEMEIDN